jgi:hypothetical protein
VDPSVFLFPESFRPGGIVSVKIEDVNGDRVPEVVLVADFIVSFTYLGISPLRAEIWLRPRGDTFVSVLKINRSFGTDEGYEYSAERFVLDTDGDGFRETVKVVTEHQQQQTDQEPFRNTLVSFFVSNGSEYVKDAGEDLPKIGTISRADAVLAAGPGPGRAIGSSDVGAAARAAALAVGDTVFVFDRSDTSEAGGAGRVFRYKVVTRDGRQGWVRGSEMTMEWVDPYKMNRAAFLGAGPPAPPSGSASPSPTPVPPAAEGSP